MEIQFCKYSATGNDFVMVDDRRRVFPIDNIDLIKKICARRTGIGADGLMLIQPSDRTDFRMRHFNPDGNEAEMCGNGARSIIKFANYLDVIKNKTTFESMLDRHEGLIEENEIKIKMNPPRNLELKKKVGKYSSFEPGGYIEIGVPHYVLFVEELATLNVQKFGCELAHHAVFPKGANVDFVQIYSENNLFLRTFERGVEAETLSCGTGATASAIIANKLKGIKSPVKINVLGGNLSITFDAQHESIWLAGPVEKVYKGVLNLV